MPSSRSFFNASDALRAARADGRHYVPLSLNRLGRVINTHGDILVSNANPEREREIKGSISLLSLRSWFWALEGDSRKDRSVARCAFLSRAPEESGFYRHIRFEKVQGVDV